MHRLLQTSFDLISHDLFKFGNMNESVPYHENFHEAPEVVRFMTLPV